MDNFKSLLMENDYQVTDKRLIIYEIFNTNRYLHLDVDEVLELARKKDSSISIATVYRTLKILTDLDLISSIEGRYEFKLKDSENIYPHFVCEKCGEVVFVTEPILVKQQLLESANEKDFEVNTINLNITGICSKCKE